MLIRTTLRLNENLKKSVDQLALDEGTTVQDIFNRAVESYLKKDAKKKVRKIIFKPHSLGVDLDNLTREDFYPDPKIDS